MTTSAEETIFLVFIAQLNSWQPTKNRCFFFLHFSYFSEVTNLSVNNQLFLSFLKEKKVYIIYT